MIHPDPAERFESAEDAETSDDGAAGFLRQLVKSDLPDQYERDMRRWIERIDPRTDLSQNLDPTSSASVPQGTTRMLDVRELKLEEFSTDGDHPDE